MLICFDLSEKSCFCLKTRASLICIAWIFQFQFWAMPHIWCLNYSNIFPLSSYRALGTIRTLLLHLPGKALYSAIVGENKSGGRTPCIVLNIILSLIYALLDISGNPGSEKQRKSKIYLLFVSRQLYFLVEITRRFVHMIKCEPEHGLQAREVACLPYYYGWDQPLQDYGL